MQNNRRDFIRKAALAGASVVAIPALSACDGAGKQSSKGDKPGIQKYNASDTYPNIYKDNKLKSKLIVPENNGIQITGTFLDEISHDIPHQNWGEAEWDLDFQYMKAIGIDTVIMIRSGYRKFITYPSEYLLNKGCFMPSVDLVDMYLRLAVTIGQPVICRTKLKIISM